MIPQAPASVYVNTFKIKRKRARVFTNPEAIPVLIPQNPVCVWVCVDWTDLLWTISETFLRQRKPFNLTLPLGKFFSQKSHTINQ